MPAPPHIGPSKDKDAATPIRMPGVSWRRRRKPRSRSCFWTGPITIVSGCRANARGSFRGHDPKTFVQMQNLLARFGNPCDVRFRSSGINRSPHNENKEKK